MKKNPKANKLATSKAMAQMRDIAWGSAMQVHIHRTLDVQGRNRDDAGLVAAAEAKRQRKAAKRSQLA